MNAQHIIDRYMEELNAELANMPDVERERKRHLRIKGAYNRFRTRQNQSRP